MQIAIQISPRASREIAAGDAWWRQNRSAAPERFKHDLDSVMEHLTTLPGSGVPIDNTKASNVRRLRLKHADYHVYYQYDEQSSNVNVLAVWHARRGRRPKI